ncbi:MAG: hypothetical protein ACK4UO_06065 [Pseudolabrys sp.]
MKAELIIFPVVRRFSHTLDALEQRDRELSAYVATRTVAPMRTRPLLLIKNCKATLRASVEKTGGGVPAAASAAAGHLPGFPEFGTRLAVSDSAQRGEAS